MLKQLRTQTKTIMWIVAAAFVGLIVLQWGADFTGRHSPGRGSPTDLGEVNGRKITVREYENALAENRRLYTDRTGQIPNELSLKMLEEQTWQNLVAETLLEQEARKLGVRVTDADVLYQVQANPPREVMASQAFQTNGRFDPQKYQQALADPNFDWSGLEAYVRSYLPQQKVQERIVAPVVVSEGEIREEFARRTETVDISYLLLGEAAFRHLPVRADEAAVQAYYDSHTQEFMRGPRAPATVVRFRKIATPDDEARARQLLAEAERELADGVAFEDLVLDYSTDASASRDGDLGWIKRGDLKEAALENALFALRQPGEISPVVRGERGFHLFQLIEREPDRVHPRMILVEVTPGRRTVAELQARAEDLRSRASGTGGLAAAARAARIEAVDTGLFERTSPPEALQAVPDAVDFCFTAQPGEISPAFEGPTAVLILQLDARTPEEPRPLAEVRGEVTDRLAVDERRERARQAATEIARLAQAGGDFARLARERGFTVQRSGLFTRAQPPPALAGADGAVAMAFALPLAQMSPVVEEEPGFCVLRVEARPPLDEERYKRERENILVDLLNRKRQLAFTGWFEGVRQRAQIVDRRAQLMAAAQVEEEESEAEETPSAETPSTPAEEDSSQ